MCVGRRSHCDYIRLGFWLLGTAGGVSRCDSVLMKEDVITDNEYCDVIRCMIIGK